MQKDWMWKVAYFDSLEWETKGQIRPDCRHAYKRENPTESDRGHEWQTSSRTVCGFALSHCYVLLSMCPQFWFVFNSCLGCALTLRKLVIIPCTYINWNDNWICIFWWTAHCRISRFLGSHGWECTLRKDATSLPRWGFMKQYRELRGHKSRTLSIHTHGSSLTPRITDCCLPGWLFTQHIDLDFVAHSSVYYQLSQTRINLLFPLTHANRTPLLSIRLPMLPQMNRQWGWLASLL